MKRASSRARGWLIATALLLVLGSGCRSGSAVAVDFALPSMDGEGISPTDYLGDVVVVDFWASWCKPCRIQHEVLTVLAREFSDQGVAFLAINSGEPEAVARAFAEDHPFEFPVLLDSDAAVSDRLGVLGLPTLLILDREGEVSYFEPGLLSPRELRDLLRQAGA